jgi:pyruvate oxidase
MNVSEALVKVLSQFGVRMIFGIPGDSINELLEAIRKQNEIRFIHVMHEEAGAFAASAQAKLTGKLAVCAGTSGPGAIHLLNGLYDAKLDHAPVLAITGQVPTSLFGNEYHQEVDTLTLFKDVAVFNQAVINTEQLPELFFRACLTAVTKKGVAHISIPRDISTKKIKVHDFGKQAIHVDSRHIPGEEALKEAAVLIGRCERPCILAGIGTREAVPQLLQLSERIQAPVIKTLRAKDILPDEHPSSLGGIGLLGTKPAYHAIKNCDLLLLIGTDFPYHEFYPDKDIPIIQIEKEGERIGRRHRARIGLEGDALLTLQLLIPLLTPGKGNAFFTSCKKEMEEWRKEQEATERSDKAPIRPQTAARMIGELANDDAIFTCDTGSVTVWGARNLRIKSEQQRFTLSGGLASMGFGLPGAIGAQLAYPGRQVIALCGDGGFAMLMADFATAVKYKLPVKVFIFNNSKLGMIQMEQEGGEGNPEYETDLHNPDYAVYAGSCGGEGFTVKDPELLEGVIRQSLSSAGPTIVNIFIAPDELTVPPEVTAEQAFNYIKAKTKEFFM